MKLQLHKKPAISHLVKKSDFHSIVMPNNVHPMPNWAFDFISIHRDTNGLYSLCSPLCLVDPVTSKRPVWEKEQFKTKRLAFERSKAIAKEHKDKGLFAVDCTDNLIIGYSR